MISGARAGIKDEEYERQTIRTTAGGDGYGNGLMRGLQGKTRRARRVDTRPEAPCFKSASSVSSASSAVQNPAILMPAGPDQTRFRIHDGVIFCSMPVSTVR